MHRRILLKKIADKSFKLSVYDFSGKLDINSNLKFKGQFIFIPNADL